MRVLVTTNAAVGHFVPLVPTLRALLEAGHDVRVACPRSFAGTVEAAGFVALGCHEQPVEFEVPPLPPADDRDGRLAWAVTASWPSDARPWVRDLMAKVSAWKPQIVVVEPVEHAGRITAAVLDVPLIEHGWGFTLPAAMVDALPHGLSDVYAEFGAAPMLPDLSVDLGARGVQSPDSHPVDRYRYVPWSQPGDAIGSRDGRARILITLGTVDHADAAQRLRTAVAAARGCGAQVVAVLGNRDRGTKDDFPDDVTVAGWVDLPAAVSSSDLVVHHGGAGTSWVTLLAGRPALIVPQAGDQFRNARLVAQAGAADVIEPEEFDESVVAGAIDQLLRSSVVAERARSIAAENSRLPGPSQLAADIVTVA